MTIDHSKKALALLATALVAASLLPIAVKGDVYANPPPLMPHWDYLVDGVLLSLTWSPSGEALAVVNNLFNGPTSSRILVISRNGTLLWDSGDLGKGIGDIAWGPNGEIVAVPILGEGLIVAIPSNGTVRDLPINNVKRAAWNMVRDLLLVQIAPTSARILTPVGNVTLLIGVGKPIHDLGWSPDGRYAYFAADDGVTLIDIDNTTRGSRQLKIPGAAKVAWSDDSRFVAIASQKTNSYFKNLTVVDLATGDQWSVSRVFYDFSFRPGTHEVLVGGNNLTLYNEDGEVLWDTRIMSPTIIVSWAYKILWHPGGGNVTLINQERELIIVDGDTGDVLWRSELGFRATYPAQDPRGEYLALIAGSRRVIAYGRASGLATIAVLTSSCPVECAIVFSGGGSVKTFIGGPGDDINLYATPGNYTVTFRLQTFPSDWGTIVGNSIGWLLNKTVGINIEVEAGEHYEISPPLEELKQAVLSGLGKLVIKGPPNIVVIMFWGTSGASDRIIIPESGEVMTYVVPDTYSVQVILPNGKKLDLGETIVKPNSTGTIDLTRLAPTEATTTTSAQTEQTTTTTLQTHTTTTTPGTPRPTPAETQTETTATEPTSGGINNTLLYAVAAVAGVLAVVIIAILVRKR